MQYVSTSHAAARDAISNLLPGTSAIAIIYKLLTLGRIGGWFPPLPEFFLSFFFLDDKTSAPDVFSSCLFITRAHFETRLVIVSYYGYEI